jgi:RNA polymerase sigma-70 factor (ECF subfamily)
MGIETQLLGIANKDEAAFAALFREHQPQFVRYATGLLAGDRSAAEDVVDDAFLAIWQQAGRYEGRGSAEGWMRRIVRNKAVDWLRKQQETPTTPAMESENAAQNSADVMSPFDSASARSTSQHLRKALNILSVEQREAVWLCYFEEKPVSEIAAIAACPENTVKTRLFHARRILRQSGLLESTVIA